MNGSTRDRIQAPGHPPRVLSIAGSDSGGGAGIQADLKAFARCGVHGMTAITAITEQNTVEVTGVHPVPPETIVGQVRAVAADIGVDAVKIGMLGSAETVAAVERALDLLPGVPVVLDPVMVAESGASLLEDDARAALIGRLLPRARVVTPNIAEARVLAAAGASGASGATASPAELALAVLALGPQAVVVTGGHREQAIDTYAEPGSVVEIPGERHGSDAAHGSGCTHSAALAAGLAAGLDTLAAARQAKRVAADAVLHGLRGLGQGAGPVDALGACATARPASAPLA